MTTITSRPDREPPTRPNRNFLYLTELDTVGKYREMVVRELIEHLGDDDKRSIRLTPVDDLVVLHTSLGRAIRNEYELWMPEHVVTSIWQACETAFPLAAEPPNIPSEVKVGGATIKIAMTAVHIDEHPCHPDNFSMSCLRELWEQLQ